MKKIPGTLYHLGITAAKDGRLNINIWYRNQLVLERKGIFEEQIMNTLKYFFESNYLSIPTNRLARIIEEQTIELAPAEDIPLLEGTVSEIIGELQTKPPEEMKKIVLIGLSNAGKTCIYQRVFERKKPWELVQSRATKGIEYKKYEVGAMTKPIIWDLGGQQQYLDEYHGPLKKNIFEKASVLLYIVDASDADRFEKARIEFEWSVNQLYLHNPKARVHVLLHKGDLIHDKNAILPYLKKFLSKNIKSKIIFHYTSIFDESLFTVWSAIIREISPKTTFIRSILKSLKDQKGVKDALLIEKKSGLACGSTINGSEEDIVIGMISLLIVTCDRVVKRMNLESFKEFRLRTDSNYLLLTDITEELMLVIILDSIAFDNNTLKEVEVAGKEVSVQIKELWME
ncbi:MAG: ADP-ribosylation factor-like protein [Candidatus Hermodarchaeota archaeon]